MRNFILFLLLFIPMISFSQKDKIFYKETQADEVSASVDSVLIMGMGSTATRIFLDELSRKLSQELKSAGVFSNYCFLGKDTTEAKLILDTLQSQSYRHILTLFPDGISLFKIGTFTTKTYYLFYSNPSMNVSTTYFFHYEQAFHCKLSLNNSTLTPFWAADVAVSGDIHRQKSARKFTENIISSLRTHQYIR